jgi:hypothetical protein
MFAAAPEVFVRLYVADPVPGPVTVTLYDPATAFAVKTAAVATPLVLVVAVLIPPANVPLAPDPGAMNVTPTPPTGLPKPSATVASNCVGNAVPTVVLCGVPAVAVILAGLPTVFVRIYATTPVPGAVAVTP